MIKSYVRAGRPPSFSDNVKTHHIRMTSRKPDIDPAELLTQKETAQRLGVDRHTVRRYERMGYIRFCVRKGRCKYTTGSRIIRCWERLHPKI